MAGDDNRESGLRHSTDRCEMADRIRAVLRMSRERPAGRPRDERRRARLERSPPPSFIISVAMERSHPVGRGWREEWEVRERVRVWTICGEHAL